MNLTAVLLIGLLAGSVTCAAVQGGLLARLITRQRAVQVGSPRARTHALSPSGGLQLGRLVDDLLPVGAFLTGKLTATKPCKSRRSPTVTARPPLTPRPASQRPCSSAPTTPKAASGPSPSLTLACRNPGRQR